MSTPANASRPISGEAYNTESGVFPPELAGRNRWFVWAYDDGRKIPRAPWAHPANPRRWVSWKDENLWVSHDEAGKWAETMPGMRTATCVPATGQMANGGRGEVVFIDLDDVRLTDTGEVHPDAWRLLKSLGVHIALSTSGEGLHGYGTADLDRDGTDAIEYPLKPWEAFGVSDDRAPGDPSVEVYFSDRFMAATGEHVTTSPTDCPDITEWVEKSTDVFDTVPAKSRRGSGAIGLIARKSGDKGASGMEEVFEAVDAVKPRDIRLRSTVTNERGDGTRELDPSWEGSESGTRLAELSDGWIYRKGMVGLSALQVVALEEGIISNPTEYPNGDDWHKAVDALRERGADIPESA